MAEKRDHGRRCREGLRAMPARFARHRPEYLSHGEDRRRTHDQGPEQLPLGGMATELILKDLATALSLGKDAGVPMFFAGVAQQV